MRFRFFRPNNLSQQLLRVIFSIYLAVTLLITGGQFLAEYVKTKDSILNELEQLARTVSAPVSTSLWQYNEKQVETLTSGLLEMPIVEGIDILNQRSEVVVSKKSYNISSVPLSILSTTYDLIWHKNEIKTNLGSLKIYSSSDVVFDRILFNFILIFFASVINISILFFSFIWAFDRFLSVPLTELISQVDDLRMNRKTGRRINLPVVENNELKQLQDHMNVMFSDIERHQEKLLEDEKEKRNWLEDAVAKRTEELLVANENLKNLAAKDSLTGILNRGSFYDYAHPLLIGSQRRGAPASFILMDIDRFKIINDTHGHFVGDKVLVHFAHLTEELLRKPDLFGRIGGEEFAIFLPDTESDEAFRLADDIRKTVGASVLDVDGETITYTISLGVASSEPRDISVDELLKRADLKLYEAKNKGRDRVQI